MHQDRLVRARASIAAQQLAALVVTHPPNIRYLTGLAVSTGALVLQPGRCGLVVDGRYAVAARGVIDDRTDLFITMAPTSVDETIAATLRSLGAAAVGIEADHFSVARFTRLGALGGDAQGAWRLVPTSGIIEGLRAVKDEVEISVLREAGKRLSAVARRAGAFVRVGRSELEVAAEVDAAVRAAGFEGAAFATIVASGPNSALPHARPTRRVLAAGDGVVLDFGGVYDGYCVDLTRTLHIGPMTADFRRLFDAVREAQAAAIATVRPGVLPSAIDAAARAVLTRRGLGEAFAHGTGHGLGLEVHEDPRISKGSPAAAVSAGMVFTIEPGVYVPGLGGVRLEDDVLVVDGGCELLTDAPLEF